MNRSWQTEHALKSMKEAVVTIEAALDKAEEMVKQKNGVPMPLAPYPPAPTYSLVAVRDYSRSYSSDRKPSEARAELEAWFKKCQEVRERNLPAIENNKQVKAEASTYIQSLGLPRIETKSEPPKGRRKAVSSQVNAGWVMSFETYVPTYDGYPLQENTYKEKLDRIVRFEAEQTKLATVKENEKAKKQREKERQITLCGLIAKYGLQAEDDADDVLEHLLGCDKYLSLAHCMLANRNDWNDGCGMAQRGLDEFVPESAEDHLIFDEIAGLCEDWDGDGRVFRDCEWNYDVIFSRVANVDLLCDYRKLDGMMER